MSVGTTSVATRPTLWSLIIASDYEFLPEGVRVFKGHFDVIMRERSVFAKIDYIRASHSFEITCHFPDSKTVLRIAHEIYVNLIITERGDDGDDLKSNLIANLFPDPEKIDKKAEIVEELISLDFTSVWQCYTQDLSMDQIIPKFVQLAIESMTSTKLVEDLNGQAIQVHAQCQEDCDRVLRKLDVLRKYHDLASRHIHHLFLTEGEDNFELGVRFFIEIEQKLVQTTLLDPLYASLRFESLIKACRVRCFPFVHIRSAFLLKSGDKLIPAVPEKDKKKRGVDFDLWLGYHYQGRGGEHLKRIGGKQFQLPPLEPLETGEQVRKWLATGIPDDPKESVEQMREDLRKAAEFGNSSSDNPKDPYFANTFLQENELSLFNLPARESLDSVSTNPPTLHPTTEIKDDFLGIPIDKQSIYRSPAMRDLRTGNRSGSENVRGSYFIQSLLDSDIQDDERLHLANIVVSQPLRAMPSSFVQSISNNYELKSVRGPHFQQSLLDSDIPESERRDLKPFNDGFSPGGNHTPDATLPTILEEAGANSRVSNYTMNQQAPEPAASDEEDRGEAPLLPPALVGFADLDLKNSTKEFADEMEANINIILKSLRNYHGEINLECHFGRVLIKPFSPSIMRSLEKAHSVPVEHMADLLLTNPKNLGFTKSITTLAADVQFLLDMRIEETNKKIWSDFAEWTVKYEYICCDHEDYDGKCATGFIIEMDADSFETKVKSAPLNFGNLNVHCTMRNWDYMISATGLQNLEEDYGGLVHAIKESTYIAPGCPTVSMSFELNHRHQIHFQNIRVRRHSRYKSYDSKTTLNIMEVHDLDFDWEEGENATTFFVTSSEKPNSIWYEASLESVEARVAFKENLDVELGEETEWTAELLLQSGVVLKDICVPANYIIAKMDGVGFYNDNGTKQLLAAAESTALTKLPQELRAGFTYW